MKKVAVRLAPLIVVTLLLWGPACTSGTGGSGGPPTGGGGATVIQPGTGGAGTTASGGATGTGGTRTTAAGGTTGTTGTGGGGTPATGGATGTGGAPSTGGAGGTATGGATGAGGSAGRGGGGGAAATDASVPDASTSAPAFSGTYHMGADISWVQHDEHYGATYVDVDGVQKDILALLKNHGFNSVRLRTFVDPKAADGYDQVDGFADLTHTMTMGHRVKQAGMGFLLSMHYSDNWADPGKQCIPVAWQKDTFAQLVQHVHDYTFNVITTLKNAGARPDLVQIGNEITPGMLIHICNNLGAPTSVNAVNGQASNWTNLGMLLKMGIQAVKEVDPTIKTVLHIDRGGDLAASMSWIMNAQAQKVPFDVFADTSYVRWQGQPAVWENTFRMLAATFSTMSFIIPEYGNETASNPATPSTMRQANDLIFGISGNRGLGAWIYEPEHPVQSGIGIGLFKTIVGDGGVITDSWPIFPAIPAAMAVYDQMKSVYASRL
jgi:arabinogalactan endo-1,4-beta-galactosidase